MSHDIRSMATTDFNRCIRMQDPDTPDYWSRERMANTFRMVHCYGIIAMLDGEPVGYAMFLRNGIDIHKLDLLTIVVDSEYRREGAGTALISNLKDRLQKHGRIRFMVEETNLAGQNFMKANGFVATELVRRPFDHTTEDAYDMQFSVKGSLQEMIPSKAMELSDRNLWRPR